MDVTVLIGTAGAVAAIFMLGHVRKAFPYLVVFVLGLEYFSFVDPGSAFTIPKMGFAGLVMSQVLTGRFRRIVSRRGLFAPLVLFSAYMMSTTFWSVDRGRSATRAGSLVLLMVLFMVVAGFVRSPKDLHRFWRAFLLYGLANAALTAYQVLFGHATIVDESGARAGGLGVNPSEGAFYTGIAILILIAYFNYRNTIRAWAGGRVVQLIMLGTLVTGILATGSRGGVVSLVVAAMFVAILSERHGGRFRVVLRYLVLLLTVGAVVAVVPQLSRLFIGRLEVSGDDQLGSRLVIWASTWQSIVNHPLLGAGISASAIPIVSKWGVEFLTYSTHNTPLAALMDGGAVGMLLFSIVALRAFSLIAELRRQSDPEMQFHGLVLTTMLVMAGVFMMSLDIMYNKLLWTLLSLIEATRLQLPATHAPPKKVRVPRAVTPENLPATS